MTYAIFLALLMTLITASSNVILKKGFSSVQPFLAVYVSVIISTVFLWIMVLLWVPKNVFYNYQGIVIFVIIGAFAPTLVRTLTYCGIHTLGASRAAPLRALTPFFATMMAIIFLKERPGGGVFFGILLILAGVVVLVKKDRNNVEVRRKRYFFYPVLAAILAGIAANLRKYGLNIMPQPIFASAVAATSSMIILTIYIFLKYGKKQVVAFLSNNDQAMRFVVIAAFLTSIGEIVDLSALLHGRVSLVVPVFAATPLMIVLLSKIFLKKEETVTKNFIIAAILIVCGIYCAITASL